MAGNNLGTAQGKIDIDSSGLKNADIALRSAGDGMMNFGRQMVGAFVDIVQTSAAFEKEMDFVGAVTNATGEQMDALKEKAISLGKDSIFGPVALSQAFVELAKAGASIEDIINGVGEAAVALATAADVEIPFAGENLINILNTFKLGAEDAMRIADLLAGAANASSVSLQDLVVSFKYAGPVAQGLGISIEELTDAISILGQVGIKGSTAGTSLRQIMLNLSPPTEKAADRMKALGIITEDGGNKFFDAEGKAKSLAEVFQILGEATKDMSDQQKTEALRDLFGVRAIPSALELMSQGAAGFAQMNDEINRTTAMDVAAERTDNLAGSLAKLDATWEAIKVQEGGAFQETLKNLVDMFRQFILFIDRIPGPLKTFLVGAVGVIGVLSILSGVFLLTIGNMVRAIRVFMEIGRAFGAISKAARLVTVANGAMSASFLANPIFLVAAAIAAVIAALVLLYFHFKPFREFIDNLWQNIQKAWDGITEGVNNLWRDMQAAWDGITEGVNNLWQDIQAAWDGIVEGFKAIPGQIASFFNRIWDAVYGFFERVFGAIGRFFSRLPGIIGRALSNAAGAVVDAIGSAIGALGRFFAQLPERVAYAIGFVIGRLIRLVFEAGKLAIRTGIAIVKGIIDFVKKLPGRIWAIFTTVLKTIFNVGKMIITAAWNIGKGIVDAIINFVIALPGRIWGFLMEVVSFLWQAVPQATSAAWSIGNGVFTAIWDFISKIPGVVWNALWTAVTTVWGFVTDFVSAAWSIGTGVFDAIIDFFVALPGRIVDLLWEAVKAIGNMASAFWDKAKSIGSSLWNGFKDGLFGSPHTKIEYAMWDMEANMLTSMKHLKRNIRSIQGMENRMPQLNAGLLGLPDAAQLAVNTNGGGTIWQQNAPLVGEAVIRDDRDIEMLARQLDAQKRRTDRARGLATVG